MPTIELENVTKVYKPKRRRKGLVHTDMGVEEVNLTIRQGEFVFVVGASGSGKSTLLRLITGEIRPNEGRVCVDEKELGWMLKLSRNRAAMMFGKIWQDPTLIRKKTIGDNLALAVKIAFGRESPRLVDLRIKKVLGLVGMSGVEKRYPVELSIGECRRVELARAMIGSPPILVLDEITADLDDDNIWDLFHLLHEINKQGTTVIMVTHASQYVNIMRRRVVTLVDGGIFGDVKKGRYGDVVEKATPRLPTRFNIKLQ